MKRRKYAAILVHFYLTWMCVDFIDRTLGVTMCDESKFIQNKTMTLDISLTNLQSYNGNCSCILYSKNTPNNVTLTTDIILECDSMSLNVSHWNISLCPTVNQLPLTMLLDVNKPVDIFLNVSKNTENATIPGSMVFKSSQGLLSMQCFGAVYDIPPSTTTPTTTTPTTTLRTTTPEPPIAETLTATIAITFGGFVILMFIIALGIRHREKRRRQHDAETANIRQVIPDIEREKVDPEMTRYSWFKSITLRLRRIYYGEQRRGRSKHGRGARGRSMAKSSSGEDSPTGTHARRKFQRLFRKKSESTSSSSATRDHSPIEDDDAEPKSGAKEEGKSGKDEVFNEVSHQRGGGIFMDVRRPSCEDLEQTPHEQHEDSSTVVTVHTGQDEAQESPRQGEHIESGATAEEEIVGTLFSNIGEKSDTDIPKTFSAEMNDDGHYADVEDHDTSQDAHGDTTEVDPDADPSNGIHGVDVGGDGHYAIDNDTAEDITVVPNGFEPDASGSVRSSVTENSYSGISKISNGLPPDNKEDLYAQVDKSEKSRKNVALFRI